MKIESGNIFINAEVDESLLGGNLIPILFLHGFTGSSSDWKFTAGKLDKRFLLLSIDLIGHGKSSASGEVEYYTAQSISKQIDDVLTALKLQNVIICGYSMGGRAALSYYSAYPANIRGLILESATPGIEEKQLREERIESDELLARKIETGGIEKFGSHWMNLPLFESLKSLPDEKYEQILNSKKDNNPTGLINSLKGFGTGTMPHIWNVLRNMNFPVLLITGEYDHKFTGINKRMAGEILKSSHRIVSECGHNIHLEKPEEFINLVNKYLNDNFF